ncbi:uncharacterized protein LOC133825808 [Humulus lupulus]|uniref:uncharacterized protein LOC133825808 n=1 Tax=Humulus lupulus TaxID=3486 RepID=UPI002B40909B|nr:uncharacterized protein LOC133825808 [Humulus lupulus]
MGKLIANTSDESAGFNEGEKLADFDNVSSPISDDSKDCGNDSAEEYDGSKGVEKDLNESFDAVYSGLDLSNVVCGDKDFTKKPEFSSIGLSFEEVYVDPEILSVIDKTVKYAEGEKIFSGSKDDWKVVMVGDDDEVHVAIEKREPKPSTHVKSPFVTEFGSSEVKETVKRKGEEVVIVRGLLPFENEIGQNVSKNDCLDYISWIEDKMNFKNKYVFLYFV